MAGLFRRLGRAQLRNDRPGQAIGLLRRALSLGARRKDVLPLLAECYLERGRLLPAILCAGEARRLGSDEGSMRAIEAKAEEGLGESWLKFRALVPEPEPHGAAAATAGEA